MMMDVLWVIVCTFIAGTLLYLAFRPRSSVPDPDNDITLHWFCRVLFLASGVNLLWSIANWIAG